jgi:hypothetical protein
VRPKTLLAWIGGVLIALAGICYAADFVWFEYRVRNAKPNDPLETVTFYYATAMKNGKVEVFYDQPQKDTCVHSIFPHGGYRPCWRFDGSGIQRVSAITPTSEFAEGDHFAGGKGSVLGADAEMAIERAPFFPTERTAKK